jgi:hypothetical protein
MTSHGRAARLRVARDVALTTPASLVAALSRIQLGSVFNPYADRCPEHDRHDAARIRRRNLVRYLEGALDVRVETMWIARDLGYRSGRRIGIPITDEFHLEQAGAMIGGAHLGRATLGPPVAERTSTAVWVVLARIGEPTLLWNAFPLHPHEAGRPLSNRCHIGAEREATWPLTFALIGMVRPKRIVAIGRDAADALAEADVPVRAVRHPSQGGQTEFLAGMCHIYTSVERSF